MAVAKLRSALGDSADNPRFIETLSKRGYRFIADVLVVDQFEELLKNAACAEIPVIVMTAATPVRAMAVASQAVLYKPLHMGRVIDVVQEHCPDGAS